MRKRYQPRSILYREIRGKWPEDCCNYPRLKGMLASYKF